MHRHCGGTADPWQGMWLVGVFEHFQIGPDVYETLQLATAFELPQPVASQQTTAFALLPLGLRVHGQGQKFVNIVFQMWLRCVWAGWRILDIRRPDESTWVAWMSADVSPLRPTYVYPMATLLGTLPDWCTVLGYTIEVNLNERHLNGLDHCSRSNGSSNFSFFFLIALFGVLLELISYIHCLAETKEDAERLAACLRVLQKLHISSVSIFVSRLVQLYLSPRWPYHSLPWNITSQWQPCYP